MITLEINNVRRDISDIDPSWLNEQVGKRRDDDVAVCLKIYIKEGNFDLVLSCGQSGGSERSPNAYEKKVLDLWNKFGCEEKPINLEKINAFLNQVTESLSPTGDTNSLIA